MNPFKTKQRFDPPTFLEADQQSYESKYKDYFVEAVKEINKSFYELLTTYSEDDEFIRDDKVYEAYNNVINYLIERDAKQLNVQFCEAKLSPEQLEKMFKS